MIAAYLPNFQLPKISLSSLGSGVNWALDAAVNSSHEITRFAFQGAFTWIFAATFLGTIENTLEKKFPELTNRVRTCCDKAAQQQNAREIEHAKAEIQEAYHDNFNAGVAQTKAGFLTQARDALAPILGDAAASAGESDQARLARELNAKSDAELQQISGQCIIGQVGNITSQHTEDQDKQAATTRGILTARIQMKRNLFYYNNIKKIAAFIFAGVASSYMMNRDIGNGFLSAGLLWLGQVVCKPAEE